MPIAGGRRRSAASAGTLTALPIVGALLGALAGLGGLGAAHLGDSRYAAPVALVLNIVLNGAIHLDGYLDSCDALFASVPAQRRLEIMKDPRHGTFALAGLTCLVILWLTSVSGIQASMLPAGLAWIACTARWAAVLNAYYFPYAGQGASQTAFHEKPSIIVLGIIGLVLCVTGALAFSEIRLAGFPIAAAGIAYVCAAWAARRLGGGLVGDVYGAIVCVVDVIGVCVLGLSI
jgi:adenosylcobinamide-GDP ribazoletransferase